MADEPFEVRSFCPKGVEVRVKTRTPDMPGWWVVCSIHGELGHPPSAADAWPILWRHAGLTPPPL